MFYTFMLNMLKSTSVSNWLGFLIVSSLLLNAGCADVAC